MPLGGHPMGAEFIGPAHCPNLLALANELKSQGRLNAWVAACTGIYIMLEIIMNIYPCIIAS